jgi:hypothetical protein
MHMSSPGKSEVMSQGPPVGLFGGLAVLPVLGSSLEPQAASRELRARRKSGACFIMTFSIRSYRAKL